MANVIKKINIQDATYNILPEYDSNYLSATTNNALTFNPTWEKNLINTITANQNAIGEEELRAIEAEEILQKDIDKTNNIIGIEEKESLTVNRGAVGESGSISPTYHSAYTNVFNGGDIAVTNDGYYIFDARKVSANGAVEIVIVKSRRLRTEKGYTYQLNISKNGDGAFTADELEGIIGLYHYDILDSENELLKRIQGTSENSNYLDPIITLSEKPSEIINNLDTFFPQKVDGKVINVGNFRSYSDKGVSHLDIKVMVLAWANATQQEIFMQTVCGPLTIKSDKTLLWVNGKKFSHYYRLSSRDENNNLVWDNWKIVNDAEIEKYINPNVIQWNNEFNLNDYISHGDFIIRGNRTDIKNDNIPITNTGEIEAKLEVLSNQNNDTISQKLTLLNVNGGDYNIYTRVKQNDKWKPWSKLQTNIEVVGMINQTQMDDLIDNGMYSGVFENDGNPETFVLIVINNYAVAEASGNKGNQSICQLKYGLSLYDSIGYLGGVTLKMRKRDAFGFWSEWEEYTLKVK